MGKHLLRRPDTLAVVSDSSSLLDGSIVALDICDISAVAEFVCRWYASEGHSQAQSWAQPLQEAAAQRGANLQPQPSEKNGAPRRH
ncbi:hypothetical protein GCM10028796_12630 [Ramlibacter monticola]|uniref:hypothetical protein n=1 Tax=Ramlibacter monticola TaxID=1926872 RepID=UPI001F31F3B1|nr:hypothetical protein [Ramlibacter monticola]